MRKITLFAMLMLTGVILSACSPANNNSTNDSSKMSLESQCNDMGGKWISQANECEGITENNCTNLGGEFNSCASACRNDPSAQVCTQQCVRVCTIS